MHEQINADDRLATWALLSAAEALAGAAILNSPPNSLFYVIAILNSVAIFGLGMSLKVVSPLRDDLVRLCFLDILIQVFGLFLHRSIYDDGIYTL